MQETAALAARRSVRLHTHLAETADEAEFCQARFGCSPLDYLEQCGWLRPGTWLAHGIHFSPGEITRLGRAKVGVTHCPCSNQLLASGTCPVCELEAAGVAVGLGVDGSASNDGSNLMQEVRAALLLQRGANGIAAVSHRDALRWATQGSADCIGRPELGRIEVGAAADLALFSLDELRFSGAGDPVAALVLCGAYRATYVAPVANRRHPLTHVALTFVGACLTGLLLILHDRIHPIAAASAVDGQTLRAVRVGPRVAAMMIIYTTLLSPIVIWMLQRIERWFKFESTGGNRVGLRVR